MLAYRTGSCAPALRQRPSVPAVRQPVRAQVRVCRLRLGTAQRTLFTQGPL